jgi:hypothetical protein
MEKMKMRDEVVMKCKNAAAERLVSEVSTHKNYSKLLEALIVQVTYQSRSNVVAILCLVVIMMMECGMCRDG